MARDVAPSFATVLIEGESGTGKELLARRIHADSPRSAQSLVEVNCAAIPENLAESVLFGHERGAFTGATHRRLGAFERAHQGTLVLDEISETRPDIQAKLLRVIQERELERVGGSAPIQVDARVIAITNRDLEAEVEAGRFRRDLYYRLAVVTLRLPPLRDRLDDLPVLVDFFIRRFAASTGLPIRRVSAVGIDYLRAQLWPGNIRELANTVERALLLSRADPLVPEDFDPRRWRTAARDPDSAPDAPVNLKEIERQAIERALQTTGGNRTRAARLLGISDRTLRNKLKG